MSTSNVVNAWATYEGPHDALPTPSWICGPRSERPPVAPPLEALAHPVSAIEETLRHDTRPPPSISFSPIAIAAACHCDEREAEILALRNELAQTARRMAALRSDILAASEGELVGLALAIAERVVGHELRTDPRLVERWAHEAVNSLADKSGVTIAIAPDIAASFAPESWDASWPVVVDPTLAPSRCEVRGKASSADAGAGARLTAVAAAFGIVTP